jgi:hypothetical protein
MWNMARPIGVEVATASIGFSRSLPLYLLYMLYRFYRWNCRRYDFVKGAVAVRIGADERTRGFRSEQQRG